MGINLFEITGIAPEDPEVIAAGEDFDEYANLIVALVSVRKSRGIRQRDVARAMGTKQSAVSDIERVGGNPTVRTLQRYARAVGCRIRLIPSSPGDGAGWSAARGLVAESGPAQIGGVVQDAVPVSEYRFVA